MSEQWKEIAEYEGLYEVSSFGRVRCLDYNGRNPTRDKDGIRSLNYANGDYPRITLSSGKRNYKTHLVHRLVVSAFVGDIPDGMDVNHKDGNKKNNHVDNLEIVTKSENVRHAIDNGFTKVIGIANPAAKLTEKDIPIIRGMIKGGHSLRAIGRKFNVSAGTIHYIKYGKTWTHV